VGFILALDQGTTSSRAVVYDETQRVLASAQQEFTQHFPRPGWVEHDPLEIWRTQRDVAVEALAKAGIGAHTALAAIGITNQRETTVVWDRRDGRPIHNAIVWQDRRTAEVCEKMHADGHETLLRETTGLVLDPYFSASKIRWILDHCDGAAAAAAAGHLAFGTIDSWLIWNLTEGRTHITDPTNASRTALYSLHSHDWDERMLELWGVPRSMLPRVARTSGELAECSIPEFANVPVAGIAGDQQAALFGQACFDRGDAKCTYGTGCFLLMNCGDEAVASDNRLLTSVAWDIDGAVEYALEGSVFIGGATVQWLRDGLQIIERAADVEKLAASVDSSDGVVLVPAFSGLGAPYWDPRARGSIMGITRGTTKAHIARAALEGIACQVADVLDAMQKDTGETIHALKVDGGASANDLLMQLQCDILQAPLLRSDNAESTALGAAGLAGLGVGLWSGRDELRGLAPTSARFEPSPSDTASRELRKRWARAVARSQDWLTDNASL